MTRISASFLKAYPKLSAWMEANIPKVQNKHKVWQAFVKYSELPPVKAGWALTPGYNPDIHFQTISGSNGKFVGQEFPNRIYLAKEICDKFEKYDFADPRMHKLVESSVLHEMVH